MLILSAPGAAFRNTMRLSGQVPPSSLIVVLDCFLIACAISSSEA